MEKNEFLEKVKAVATVLGMQIRENDNWSGRYYEIIGEDSISISVSNPQYPRGPKSNLTFCGNFPRGDHGHYYGPYNVRNEISVSADKTPERIAKDIQRRLLPDYLEALNKALEWKEKTEKREARERANLKKLADYFNLELTDQDLADKIIWVSHPLLDIRVKVYDEDMVEFTLKLTPDAAIRVFGFLNKEVVINADKI